MGAANTEQSIRQEGVAPPAAAYGWAIAAVALAALAHWLIDPLLGDYVPGATFCVAIIAAAWVGGLRPALLATVLGLVLVLCVFVPPRFAFFSASGPHLTGLAMYALVGFAIALFGGAMRAAQRRSQKSEELARRQAERLRVTLASIREAQEELTATLESITDGFWKLDRDWRFVHVNGAAARSVGLPRSTLLGRNLWETFPAAVGTQVEAEYRRAAVERVAVEFENIWEPLHKWFEIRVFPTSDGGLAILTQDVTERKRAAEVAAGLNQELRENDRHKDEFLAMLAHELRNPLAPIRNAVQVLQLAGPADATLQHARAVIARQVSHMVRLVDDLMDVSGITRGKIVLQQESVDLSIVVGNAIESSRPLLDARRHELQVSLPPEPVWVQGDATRLAQVVLNLLNNAAKYTLEGGHVRLTIERAGDEARLRVRDDGVGIAATLLPKVFDLFIQAERTLDRAQGGLGIGLTLVKKLVEMHGGTVEASSEGLGKGSEFVVRLPMQAEPPRSGRTPSKAAPEPERPDRASRRILVVDDNVDAADSLATLLQLMGNDARTAYNGQTALALIPEYRPDVVLLDIGLPGMDGHEVARRLRRLPGCAETALVALTGYDNAGDRRDSEEVGFYAHLIKPVDLGELEKVLAGLSNAANK